MHAWFDPQGTAVSKDGGRSRILDVPARNAGILGSFSRGPGMVTYYANGMGLK
ncbi:MAG TPA: hypothetical protein VHA15_11680 [Burkholderiales bacterium]|nr:hypothetical protein [Burkholderiales bacterium]